MTVKSQKIIRRGIFVMLQVVWVRMTLSGMVPADEAVSLSETEAVAGGVAMLFCNITPPIADDTVSLVIWYKDVLQSPIYSYDSRDKSSKEASHWSDDKTVGGRVSFELGLGKYPARLTLQAVRDSDGGLYRCRVDFKKSPTRNHNVNLTVILPPDSLAVRNEKGEPIQNYILGPYPEGSSVNITCIATGGRPPPRVTWWQENALLDDTFEKLPNRQIRNVLQLEKLERRHLNAVFTCQASNNNLVAPISSAVTLDLALCPLNVRILGENRPFSADNKYNITCQVVGTRPPPRITWWKGNFALKNSKRMVSEDGNITTSVVTFTPSVEDYGKTLTCRAESHNPSASDRVYEDSWKLNVHHVPIVALTLGSELNQNIIREGVDVYFECNIKSNPWVYKLTWRHNGKTIHNNPGVVVSNQNLVLQNITRTQAGLYTCVGSNQEGDGESSPLYLDVKFAPVCRPGQETTYGVGRNEVGVITCEIESNPTNLNFTWKFKSTSGTVTLLPEQFTTEGTRSQAKFTPLGELDYGTLYCWARNELGIQLEPCAYYIIPAGRPDTVSNCTTTNQTFDALTISCESGFDGGLSQEFGMEVRDAVSKELIRNSTGSEAIFTITGLVAGAEYDVRLYAYNAKGRSPAASMTAFTLKSPQKRTGVTPPEIDLRSLIGVFVGCGVSVVLLVCILLVIKIRCRSSDRVSQKKLDKKIGDSIMDGVEKDPDIIPHNEEYLDEDEKAFERLSNSTRYYGVECVRDRYTLPVKLLPSEDITYAELSLSNTAHMLDAAQFINKRSHIEEPTVYAQIETCSKPVDASDISQETPLLNGHHRESMV